MRDRGQTSLPDAAVGEAWAYRARRQDPLVQVMVLKVGVKTPRRLLIRFVDDDFEGRQNWVPSARLKALWHDVDAGHGPRPSTWPTWRGSCAGP